MKILTRFCVITTFLVATTVVSSQSTGFTYQGKLTDGGAPASGSYQFQFKLFDAAAGGTQIGSTLTDVPANATNGVFKVSLNFGAPALNGANRWIEIYVRRNTGEPDEPYVMLSPREQISSSPYAVRTLSAAMADDSQKLGGIDASEYVTNATGASSFIRNNGTLQTANFNISGNGMVGGNLGVGTVSPQSRVGIQTTDNAYGFTHTNGTTTVGTYTGLSAGWLGTKSNHPLYFFTNDSLAQATLATNGNFGIGTTSPGQRLEVNGIIRTTSAVGDCPSGWFCSLQGWDASVASLYTSGVVNRSDARLKRNVRPLVGVGGKLLALTGVSYEWKEGRSGTQYGFIAQDVEEVLPDLVTTDDRGYKSVNYMAMIPFAVEMIKTQQRSIQNLEFRVAQLEAALARSRAASTGSACFAPPGAVQRPKPLALDLFQTQRR